MKRFRVFGLTCFSVGIFGLLVCAKGQAEELSADVLVQLLSRPSIDGSVAINAEILDCTILVEETYSRPCEINGVTRSGLERFSTSVNLQNISTVRTSTYRNETNLILGLQLDVAPGEGITEIYYHCDGTVGEHVGSQVASFVLNFDKINRELIQLDVDGIRDQCR